MRRKGGEAAKTPRFRMSDFIFLIGEGIAYVLQSQDTLMRRFWIAGGRPRRAGGRAGGWFWCGYGC